MPIGITVEMQGWTELQKRLDMAGTQGRILMNEGMRDIGRLFVPAKGTGAMAMETPVRTGKLRRSTFFEIRGSPPYQELRISQPAMTPEGVFYGHFVREGTMPHDIFPKKAKALRFEIGGKVIFAAHVKHPGTKPNPYHMRVWDRLKPAVQNVIDRMGQKMSQFLAGR